MKTGDISYWIAADRLGILEQQLEQLGADKNKRNRKAEFARMARLLKDLKLVSKDEQIVALALGVDCLGERGVIINCTTPVQMVVPLPTGEPK